jgi:SpoVK/Ycf46/Vps4 family AAA+-type ATPase
MPRKAPIEQIAPVEEYSYGELRSLLLATLRAGISVLLRGHPGVGKSSLARELAAAMGLPLVDIRLAQRDPAEICGVYFPDRDKQVLALFPPEWVQQACAQPCFVFLDEINAAVTKLHQAAAYQIVLEHRVGPHRFHPDTVVMAAGNLEEDNAIVTTLSSALCNRFAHYVMRVDANDWLGWAQRAGIGEEVCAYIGRHGEEALYHPMDGGYAFPTPRSWEMASRVLARADERDAKRVVAACVGPEAAEMLFNFLRVYRRVDARKIIEQGATIDFARGSQADPSFVYAAVFSVGAYVVHEAELRDEQLPNIVRFARSRGLDPEYQFLFLRQLRRRDGLLERLRALPEYRRLAGELVSLQAELYQ